ncbi:MAG TPA: CRTAC1 family protein [Urbifossiella sp.]|nr:CRTAC1 family protein [Urbifossiella sp.]
MRTRILSLVAALGGAVLAGCSSATPEAPEPVPPGPPWFEEATAAYGLDFVHDAGPTGNYFTPQSVGSGGALLDFDNDGLLDLYLLNNAGPKGAKNRLYRQHPAGTFKEVANSGLEVAGFCMGAAAGDVNNDGFVDIALTEFGRIRLFLNNGNGTFTDISESAGVRSPLWAMSAAFVDYDRDGWLDLVVPNYIDFDPTWDCTGKAGDKDFCGPNSFKGTVAKLFHNRGAARPGEVRFEDVTLASGLGRKVGPGLGVVCADFSGDGWPDIFIANDGAANHLWINQKNGAFKEEAIPRGLAYNRMGQAEAGMGIALGDVDNDGLFDLFVTHLTWESNTLWRQGPRGSFSDFTGHSGLGRPAWHATGWGTTLTDFNNDGLLDLAYVNGRVKRGAEHINPELGPFWKEYGERNQVFAGWGDSMFKDLSRDNPAFSGKSWVSRGLMIGDLDNDGTMDLVTTSIAGPARIFRNVAPNRGHWLSVRTLDPRLKRDAYGAEVVVRAGSKNWWRLVNPGSSFLCSSDPRIHVGLGSAASYDAVEVLWPDGLREAFAGGAADRALVLRRGEGKPLPAPTGKKP